MKNKNHLEFERCVQDEDAFIHMIRTSPCFICRLVNRTYDEAPMHILYEDDQAIAFLERWPRMYGHTLVASRDHREQVTGDFTLEEYLTLQGVVYRLAEAIRHEVAAERLYLFTFGSKQAIAHVHWHIVPLPSGVPFHDQQAAIFRRGILKIPNDALVKLKTRIIQRLNADK